MAQVRNRPWGSCGRVIGALLALGLASAGEAQERSGEVSAGRQVAQVATGTLLTPVGFFGAGWAAEHLAEKAGWSEQRAKRAAYVAAYSGAALAAAAGPTLVGDHGRFSAALGGSVLGMGAAVLSSRLGNALYDGDKRRCGVLCWTLGALTVALPSIGATVAYTASRP